MISVSCVWQEELKVEELFHLLAHLSVSEEADRPLSDAMLTVCLRPTLLCFVLLHNARFTHLSAQTDWFHAALYIEQG